MTEPPIPTLMMTLADLERIHAAFPDLRMELVNGEIRIKNPRGGESGEISGGIAAALGNWVHPRRLGRVFGASAGFVLPNKTKDVRVPCAAFVRADRMRRVPTGCAELAPDLIADVCSPADSPTQLREKIQSFLEVGTHVGILVDPESRTVEVYRPGENVPQVLRDGDVLTAPEVLPGWSVAISDLWPEVF